MSTLTYTVALAFSCSALLGYAAEPAAPTLVPLFSKELADVPGKEALMLTVEYPPGAASEVHRHEAHGFIYVLEGSVVMQVAGGAAFTLTAGQTFYEGPNDVHTVSRNASATEPAKVLVLLLKKKGVPPVLPAN